jgi:hypothetical protein
LEKRVGRSPVRFVGGVHVMIMCGAGGRTKAMTVALNLAIRLKDLGNLEETVLMEREVMEKRKRISGVEHSHTITTMSNLAVALFLLGKLEVMEWSKRIFCGEQSVHYYDHG